MNNEQLIINNEKPISIPKQLISYELRLID